MSYFKAEMHQIRFRLGLRQPRTPRGAHSAPSNSLAGFKGSYTSKGIGGRDKEKNVRGGKKGGKEGEKGERNGR